MIGYESEVPQPGPSNHFYHFTSENCENLEDKEPPRKRRKNDEIQQNIVFECQHCTKTLTRKQTLRDHINKFHRQNLPSGKG